LAKVPLKLFSRGSVLATRGHGLCVLPKGVVNALALVIDGPLLLGVLFFMVGDVSFDAKADQAVENLENIS
jgi:hypothetical protein